jgi:hypothetical protein
MKTKTVPAAKRGIPRVPHTLITASPTAGNSDQNLDASLATAIARTIAVRQAGRFTAYPDYGLEDLEQEAQLAICRAWPRTVPAVRNFCDETAAGHRTGRWIWAVEVIATGIW